MRAKTKTALGFFVIIAAVSVYAISLYHSKNSGLQVVTAPERTQVSGTTGNDGKVLGATSQSAPDGNVSSMGSRPAKTSPQSVKASSPVNTAPSSTQPAQELDNNSAKNPGYVPDHTEDSFIDDVVPIGNIDNSRRCGDYPSNWCLAEKGSITDTWGMLNRYSVSYAAYKVHKDFEAGKNDYDMPGWSNNGNANQWDDNARADGIDVNETPLPGSIAISHDGISGHAMYVEAVNDDGTLKVSQYDAAGDGKFSYRYSLAITGLVFIHF